MNIFFSGKCPSNPKKHLGVIFFFAAILTFQPKNIFAYDNDTHFWLTYYLAVKAGYNHVQATQIASADVSVDFDRHVTPVVSQPATFFDWRHPQSHLQDVRARFHALPWTESIFEKAGTEDDRKFWWNPTIEDTTEIRDIMQKLVEERKKCFWKETLDDTANQNPGMFLHFLQDIFAHRNFRSYIGHAGYYGVDFLSTDREKAEQMTFETMKYLLVYRYQYLKRNRPDLFVVQPGLEFDPQDINAVSDLQIEKILSAETVLEIRRTLEELCKVNISGEMQKNQLVGVWDKLKKEAETGTGSQKVLLKKKRPPRAFLKPLTQIARFGVVPDSRKARKVIQNALGITDENRLPHIWLYDYDKFGRKRKAVKARKYYPSVDYVSKPFLTAGDERKSTKESKIYQDDKRQCLPFSLVDDKAEQIPFCFERKEKNRQNRVSEMPALINFNRADKKYFRKYF